MDMFTPLVKTSRRSLLGLLAFPLLLAGCSTTTVNGVTTVTLNMARINLWVTAVTKASQALLADNIFASLIGATVSAAMSTAAGKLASLMSALNALANGAATLTFNASSPPAAFSSLMSDLQEISGYVTGVLNTAGPTKIGPQIVNYIQAIQTLVALFVALTSLVAAPKLPMTENQALIICGVKPLN